LNLLQRGVFGNTLSTMRESLEQMAQSNQTLLSMVDTLLEVYQYEAGGKTLDFFVVDLWELCQQVVQELMPLANVKQLSLKARLKALFSYLTFSKVYYSNPISVVKNIGFGC
jgi:signal transduction histidine kinase